MGTSEYISDAVSLYQENAKPLLLGVLSFFLIGLLMVVALLAPIGLAFFSQGDEMILFTAIGLAVLLFLVVFLVMVGTWIGYLGLIYDVRRKKIKSGDGFGTVFGTMVAWAKKKTFSMLFAAILIIAFFAFLAALFAAAVFVLTMFAELSEMIAPLSFLVLLLFALLGFAGFFFFSLTPIALVVENTGAAGAVKKSASVVSRKSFSILLILLLFFFVQMVFGIIPLGGLVSLFIVMPIQQITLLNLYLDARKA